MLEADWLHPAALRTLVGLPSELTTSSDAVCATIRCRRTGSRASWV